MNERTKKITMMSMLIALSVVLAYIKIPSPTGSVALDAIPGYFAGAFITPLAGGIVGAIGHFFTALNSGFPLSLPVHIVIMFTMFVACFGFGFVYKKNKVLGVVAGIFLNTVVSLGLTSFLIPIQVIVSLILPLLVASTINVIIATVLYEIISKRV